MDLGKSGVRKGNSGICDSKLFGITDKAAPRKQINAVVDPPISLNYEARKRAMLPRLKAECAKAVVITLIRRTSIR